jgi:hypothetical protein
MLEWARAMQKQRKSDAEIQRATQLPGRVLEKELADLKRE